MHKVFISYHHCNDQDYKEDLVELGEKHSIFMDRSVDTGEIPENLSDENIRRIIRDRHLRDSTVTIVLVGIETRCRKHVDWEIYSSMFDGSANGKSGIVVINLPEIMSDNFVAPHGEREKAILYPDITSWISIDNRAEYERRYPFMPDRIIDNLVRPDVKISVAPWERIDKKRLKFLIDAAFENRLKCEYDLGRRMRRANS